MKPFYKTALLCFLPFLFIIKSHAQTTSWQWAGHGGCVGNTSGDDYRSYEKVNDVAVGPDNNYYFIAEATADLCGLFGEDFETYNTYTNYSHRDILFFSTNCDGTFRWLKIIGGGGDDFPIAVTTDAQGGVYVSGTVKGAANPNYEPVHYSTDSIKDYGGYDTPSTNNKSLFLIKYNTAGEYQWLNEAEDEPANPGSTKVLNMVTGPDGTTHQLVDLFVGSYFDGELTVPEGEDQVAIITYDAQGNITDHMLLPMETNRGFYNYPFAYDPATGHYYIADFRDDYNDPLGYDGNLTENSCYLICLDEDGNVLWRIEDTTTIGVMSIMDVEVDENSNVYLTGKDTNTGGGTNPGNNGESFAGYEFDQTFGPDQGQGVYAPYLIKLDAEGNLLWGSNPEYGVSYPGWGRSISFRNGEVGLGASLSAIGQNFWGGVEFDRENGAGTDPVIVRFDQESGEVLGIEDIYGNYGYYDEILAMATDQAGNYVVGGYMTAGLFTQDTEVPPLGKNGGHADFFVAQWGDGSCAPVAGVGAVGKEALKAYPNPVKARVSVNVKAPTHYTLYGLNGKLVKTGQLTARNNSIGMAALPSGLYLLQLQDKAGHKQTIKVVKN